MHGVALTIVLLIASCAPDYAHSAFLCDARHGCPDGQDCIQGRCRRAERTGEDVVCSSSTCDGVLCGGQTCDRSQQCCVDGSEIARCAAAGVACLGRSALCDGRADCRAGDYCCADGDSFCDAHCDHYACRLDGDCPPTTPSCCGASATTVGECAQLGC